MTIALIPNTTRTNAVSVANNIAGKLSSMNISFMLCQADDEASIRASDVVIAVGGDGSIIRTAKLASRYHKPILGVNAGNVAFMAGLENDELDSLSALVTGEFTIDKRMMLNVNIYNEKDEIVYSDCCLNDVVIGRGREIKLIEAEIFCDGRYVDTLRSDGVVFSTSTGSTAYSLSAGGPVAEPTLRCIMMTPVSPFTLSSRPIIFCEQRKITVRVNDYNSQTVISCDGYPSTAFDSSMRAEISCSEYNAEFIRIKNDQFWDILKNKIH